MILSDIIVYFHSPRLDLAYSGHTVGALKRPGSWEDLSAVTYCIYLTDSFFFIWETGLSDDGLSKSQWALPPPSLSLSYQGFGGQ